VGTKTCLMKMVSALVLSFHSINVPSEWGPFDDEGVGVLLDETVSIQLMSPASGDC
jgi:hypothetical protein